MSSTKSKGTKKSKSLRIDFKDAVVQKLTEIIGKAHVELVDHQVENYKLTRLIEMKKRENQFLREIIMDYCTNAQYESYEMRRKKMNIDDDSDEEVKDLE